MTAFEWNGSDGVLYDMMEPGRPICYKASCDDKNPDNRLSEVPNGEKHNDGDTAFISEFSDTGNIALYENWPENRTIPNDDPKKKYNEAGHEGTQVIPNQVDKELSIVVPSAPFEDEYKYEIINALGQHIASGLIHRTIDNKVSIDGVASGVYTLILYSKNSKFVYKFVIY